MRIRGAFTRIGRFLTRFRAELMTGLALLAGWALFTAGAATIAGALAPWLRVPVWLLSGGALALSLGGWKLLRTVAAEGLYALTREVRRG